MAVSSKVDATMITAAVATDASEKSNSGFSRKLAASDKRTRDRGIAGVTKWLKSRPEVSETELRKIWKGLFYCLWHTDKEAVQTELSISISQILLSLNTSMAIDFFRAFQLTMRREWSGIDRLRMDKFYTLIRKFVSAVFQFLHRQSFDSSTVALFMDCFQEGTLLPADKFGALGIKLHMADIYLEELGLVTPIQKISLFPLLKPFMITLALDADKTLFTRIDLGVFQPLLEATRSVAGRIREGNELAEGVASSGLEGGLNSQDFALISEQLFDLASSATTVEKNRKLLYQIQSDFAQLAKSLPASAASSLTACSSGGKPAKKGKDEAKTSSEGVAEEEGAVALKAKVKLPKVMKSGELRAGNEVSGGGRKGKAGETKTITEVADMQTDREAVSGLDGGKEGVVLSSGEGGGEATVSNLEGLFKAVTAKGESPIASGTRLRRKAAQVDRVVGDGEAAEDGVPPSAKKARSGPKVARGSTPEKSAKAAGVNGWEKRGEEVPAGNTVGDGGARVKNEGALQGGQKRKRRVRFSLQANLFFAKSGPVPPPSLRTPPSATPRGSALKQGVKAGPVNLRLLKAPEELLGTRDVKVRGSPALVTMRKGRGGGRGGRATKVMSRMGMKMRSPSKVVST